MMHTFWLVKKDGEFTKSVTVVSPERVAKVEPLIPEFIQELFKDE